MIAVSNQGGAVNLAPDPDAQHRHHLVADKTRNPGKHHPAERYNRLRVEQTLDRLVSGEQGAEQDDRHDQHPGNILNPTIAIGEGRVRFAPRQNEGHPQRNGGARIADIVDGIRQ